MTHTHIIIYIYPNTPCMPYMPTLTPNTSPMYAYITNDHVWHTWSVWDIIHICIYIYIHIEYTMQDLILIHGRTSNGQPGDTWTPNWTSLAVSTSLAGTAWIAWNRSGSFHISELVTGIRPALVGRVANYWSQLAWGRSESSLAPPARNWVLTSLVGSSAVLENLECSIVFITT